ncbi:protein TolR [Desulforhopalus sp. IMCC35007]|uniref:protein TolR n=1 Tax=Desulforhopalus sp. IMCC35007 TaxID=2569543 RepID=UPI0010AED2FA|nr:protein TolR [Desulforhopalus sp. IMCC35007]TKB10359.1 protein TolR [Desulforhopalus sp. IMCC35007]
MGPMRGNGKKRLVSEINVTPLVDVMLVLLIIFMVTAPMMTQGLDVDLPETTSKSLRQEEHPIVITLDKDGITTVNEIPLANDLLIQELDKKFKEDAKQAIYLRADKLVAYGEVAKLMDTIKSVGFDKIGMVTKQPENK